MSALPHASPPNLSIHLTAAATAPFDPTFGKGGRVVDPRVSAASSIARQSDGKLVGADGYIDVLRYTAAGAPDPSFGKNGIAAFPDLPFNPVTVLPLPDGKLMVAGYQYSGQDQYSMAAIRLNSNGMLDSSFGAQGILVTAVRGVVDSPAIGLQPDGSIILETGYEGGNIPGGYGNGAALVRLTPAGKIDTHFGQRGYVRYATPATFTLFNSFALQPDGKILLAGFHGLGNPGLFMGAVVRFTKDGAIDQSFNHGELLTILPPKSPQTIFYGVVVSGGRIYLAGTNNLTFVMASLNLDGSLHKTFGDDGIKVTAIPFTATSGTNILAAAPNGEIAAMGVYSAVILVQPDGQLDQRFGTAGQAHVPFNGQGDLLLGGFIQPDGKLVVGGEAGQGKGLALARLILPSASPTALISGKVFEDLNGDGKQDDGEPSLAGWTIFLDANNNGKLDPGETSTTTDSQGNYHFTVAAGTYNVREVLMKGFKDISPASGVYSVTLSSGQSASDRNFGNIEDRPDFRPPHRGKTTG